MLDPDRPEELAEAGRLNERMISRALAMEGTCTGEHGVGYGKMDFFWNLSFSGGFNSTLAPVLAGQLPSTHPF